MFWQVETCPHLISGVELEPTEQFSGEEWLVEAECEHLVARKPGEKIGETNCCGAPVILVGIIGRTLKAEIPQHFSWCTQTKDARRN